MYCKKIMACILAGVLLLTGMGGHQIASANSPDISNDENGRQDYEVARYPNVLWPTSKWVWKTDFDFSKISWIKYILNGRTVVMPSIVTDREYTKRLTKEDYEKLYNYEQLKTLLSPKELEEIPDSSRYTNYKELSSSIQMRVTVLLKNNRVLESPNKLFTSNEKYSSLNPVGKTNETVFDGFSKSELESFGLTSDVLSGEKKISIEEFQEVYKKIIPRNNWPIVEEKKININPTLPKIKEEVLKKKIDHDMFFFIFETDDTRKVALAVTSNEYYVIDFYTGELYFNHGGRDRGYVQNPNIPGIKPTEHIKSFFLQFKYLDERDCLYFYPEYLEDYLGVKTYGDAINFIQKFPIEEQIDYSNSDFSKSEYVDIEAHD